MALRFGDSTSQRAQFTIGGTFFAAFSCVAGGWFKPTTLTAGRHYFGVGTSAAAGGLRVGVTTSELELVLPKSTTSPVWTTSGAGVTVDEWVFLAASWIASSASASAPLCVRIYRGDGLSLTSIPFTNTAASAGNTSNVSTSFAVGNSTLTTPATSLQGLIDSWFVAAWSNSATVKLVLSAGVNVATSPPTLAAADAYSLRIENEIIIPAMRGGRRNVPMWNGNSSGAVFGMGQIAANGTPLLVTGGRLTAAYPDIVVGSVSGAPVLVDERSPGGVILPPFGRAMRPNRALRL